MYILAHKLPLSELCDTDLNGFYYTHLLLDGHLHHPRLRLHQEVHLQQYPDLDQLEVEEDHVVYH